MRRLIIFMLFPLIVACGSSSNTTPEIDVQTETETEQPVTVFVNPYTDFPDVTWRTFWCVYEYDGEWKATTYSFGEAKVRWLEELTENQADLKYYGDYRLEDGLLTFSHFKYGEQWLAVTAEEPDRYRLCWKYSKAELVESFPCEMEEFFFFDVSDAEAFLEENEEPEEEDEEDPEEE